MKRSPKTLWREESLAPHVARALISLGLAAVGALAFTGPRGKTAASRTVPVAIAWHCLGGVLKVTATTPKKGTGFVDRWSLSPSLALTSATTAEARVGNETACVSTARILESALVPDTTYTFSYSIVVKAGDNTWSGSGSIAITVGPDGKMLQPRGAGTSI